MLFHNCPHCSPPVETSGKAAVALAETLFSRRGTQVIGWDSEWPVDYEGRVTISAEKMIEEVRRPEWDPRMPGKLVLLTHDAGFGSRESAVEFRRFVRMARAEGYEFRSLADYPYD